MLQIIFLLKKLNEVSYVKRFHLFTVANGHINLESGRQVNCKHCQGSYEVKDSDMFYVT
jgi:hypothetical protein